MVAKIINWHIPLRFRQLFIFFFFLVFEFMKIKIKESVYHPPPLFPPPRAHQTPPPPPPHFQAFSIDFIFFFRLFDTELQLKTRAQKVQ